MWLTLFVCVCVCVCVCCSLLQMASQMQQLTVNEQVGHGTIKAAPSMDAEADAAVLRKAMKGLGETRHGELTHCIQSMECVHT